MGPSECTNKFCLKRKRSKQDNRMTPPPAVRAVRRGAELRVGVREPVHRQRNTQLKAGLRTGQRIRMELRRYTAQGSVAGKQYKIRIQC